HGAERRPDDRHHLVASFDDRPPGAHAGECFRPPAAKDRRHPHHDPTLTAEVGTRNAEQQGERPGSAKLTAYVPRSEFRAPRSFTAPLIKAPVHAPTRSPLGG